MRPSTFATSLAVLALAGCVAAGPPSSDAPPGSSPLGNPFGDARVGGLSRSWPLVLDRTDVGLGTTVHFNRLPTAGELHDLDAVTAVRSVVIALPAWPTDPGPLEALAQLHPEVTATVILPGYPPSRAAAEVWNLIPARLRIVALVDGPPPNATVVADLNEMRGLERVIAQMDTPSRYGFERLQRPLSFRKVVE